MGLRNFKKTRLAPTPSGYLHRGNILSFAITVYLARETGARLHLRIDDLDQERGKPAYMADIFQTLNKLGIEWDEGPHNEAEFQALYSQLQRMAVYGKALDRLRDEELVFACACSRTRLSQQDACHCREKKLSLDLADHSWRLITDQRQLSLGTLTGVQQVSITENMRNFIVRKKDGYPSYQLASVIDDIHFGIDLVVRGEDLFDSTIAQLYLADVLGEKLFSETIFVHHKLLKDIDGEKLSKSSGANAGPLISSDQSAGVLIERIGSAIDPSVEICDMMQLGELGWRWIG